MGYGCWERGSSRRPTFVAQQREVEVELPTLGGMSWAAAASDECNAQWEGVVKGRCAAVRHRCECWRRMVGVTWQSMDMRIYRQGTRFAAIAVPDRNGRVAAPELGTCQMRCASQRPVKRVFLRWKVLSVALNRTPPFLGMPSLYAIGREVRRWVAGPSA